jgi:hypothetical protein
MRDKLLAKIESSEFLVSIDVAGSLKAILVWFRNEQLIQDLIQEARDNANLRAHLYLRMRDLLNSPSQNGFVHPHDSLLLVYAYILSHTDMDSIQSLKLIFQPVSNLWWTTRYINELELPMKANNSLTLSKGLNNFIQSNTMSFQNDNTTVDYTYKVSA